MLTLNRFFAGLAQREDRIGRSEEQGIAVTARDEFYLGIGLAVVALKTQRPLRVQIHSVEFRLDRRRLAGGRSGLVSRSRLENNARTVAINLTDEGVILIDELMPIAKYVEDVATAQLSEKELRLIKRALIKAYNALDEIEEEWTTGTEPG